jgi:hypothetical protein
VRDPEVLHSLQTGSQRLRTLEWFQGKGFIEGEDFFSLFLWHMNQCTSRENDRGSKELSSLYRVKNDNFDVRIVCNLVDERVEAHEESAALNIQWRAREGRAPVGRGNFSGDDE